MIMLYALIVGEEGRLKLVQFVLLAEQIDMSFNFNISLPTPYAPTDVCGRFEL